ncbi:NLI interacting factor-like phosphatase family protein [Histomonas meleagridis]|uniref:NLI interacting factor-like phosphatase family protein n=1 Tax=Histomonas meleagridis TaxID=135588 RepID=UPI0035598B31|nr:NLI interacting factor-like phosphatase family protein [Histomonas meleagridis]KAH0802082.1 NLI interacting factor-like phosphatase family protein [Histomonas meleagridis]
MMEIEDLEKQFIVHADKFDERESLINFICFRENFAKNFVSTIKDSTENSKTKKILVLDLDETLVHSSFYQLDYYDYCIPIEIEGNSFDLYVQKRPYVDKFLDSVMNDFTVFIFTASVPQYANPIIDLLCPELPPYRRLFREQCTFVEGLYIKDLSIFHAPLENIVIVDNNPCSFLNDPSNAILSVTWEGDQEDDELVSRILPLLQECKNASDVRNILPQKMLIP